MLSARLKKIKGKTSPCISIPAFDIGAFTPAIRVRDGGEISLNGASSSR